MGKKSKRRPQASGKPTPNRGGIRSAPTEIVSYTSESNFLPPTFARDAAVPENGWAREFRYAEKELRHNSRDMDVIIRTAKAARVMRQFDRLAELMAKVELKGIAIEGADNLALLQQLKEDCESSKRISCIKSPSVRGLLSDAMEVDLGFDTSNVSHALFSNLNSLHFAAAMGDIQLLERLVALGAALDYANDDLDRDDSVNLTSKKVKKPTDGTALLLTVIGACISRQRLTAGKVADESNLRAFYEGQVECAVQLVRLGASVNVKLELPAGRDAKSAIYKMMKETQWVGKSVRELAAETGSELLVQTIATFDAADDITCLVNCRCGSRLTWKKCHAGKEADCIFYQEKDDPKKILWRYSPLAKCPCGNSNKEYFKCCWEDAAFREHYKNDETAELKVTVRSTLKIDGKEISADIYKQFMSKFTAEEVLNATCDSIKSIGLPALHPKSKIDTWDPDVYTGVMKQMESDQCFQWNDVHWNIPKLELLKRVDEWNDALQQYCDKEGLKDSEREKVIILHTASPFAPCANVNCDKVETKVKEFKTCSRCQFVGYCSHACLKEDFQFHKDNCTKMGNR